MIRAVAKRLLRRMGYNVHRGPSNRFDALMTGESLQALATLGYSPRVVIDAGAFQGDFSLLAAGLFPEARVHVIEPQPGCRASLERTTAAEGFVFHPFALAREPGTIRMWSDPAHPSTGANVAAATDPKGQTIEVEARTLDQLIPDVTASDRALLKLDLQGFELEALAGATRLLREVEVVVAEVSFFAQGSAPRAAEIVSFLTDRAFTLFDIYSLASRSRDGRLRQGDLAFVANESPLLADGRWA